MTSAINDFKDFTTYVKSGASRKFASADYWVESGGENFFGKWVELTFFSVRSLARSVCRFAAYFGRYSAKNTEKYALSVNEIVASVPTRGGGAPVSR